MTTTVELRHAHLFCGLGGGAKGFNAARPVVGPLIGEWRCVGGIDVDPAGIRDFQRMAGVPGTVLDLFSRAQYIAFHGHEPGPSWREATTADIHRAFGWERPNALFTSAPCKGFSGLLSESKSLTAKYQALNELTLRGVWLALEAYKDDPIELYVFENVPRIANRGRHLLDQITALFRAYGYAVAETTHDCGELGGLAQSRKRFLLVARHIEKVPPFLYVPDKKPLRAVGEVLGRMLLPGDLRAGPMHRIPALQWKTWVRLAFVEAGSDWRSLNKLAVEDGKLRDYLIVPNNRNGGFLGVGKWEEHRGTVTGRSLPNNGDFGIADPRAADGALQYQQYGVMRWEETCGAVIGVKSPGQGTFSVADIRHNGPAKHSNEFRIVPWSLSAQAVTSAHGTGQAVADPRAPVREDYKVTKYKVTDWGDSTGVVIAGSTAGDGAYAVADPRPNLKREKGDHYLTGGHYGVVRWQGSSGAVSASAGHDNGPWSVADPRPMPEANDKLVCRIQALDGTWHRPFTTLELAALQSLYDPEEHWSPDPQVQLEIDRWNALICGFRLDGESDQAWRERIGNAVPPKAAQAIGEVMGETLLLAMSGETFQLSAKSIWVRPLAVAISVQQATD